MESYPRWLVYYDNQKHELCLSNYQRPSIDGMNLTAEEIKVIVQSKHIDHQQLKVISLGEFV